jgi:head-tail adaptor
MILSPLGLQFGPGKALPQSLQLEVVQEIETATQQLRFIVELQSDVGAKARLHQRRLVGHQTALDAPCIRQQLLYIMGNQPSKEEKQAE